MRLQNVQDKRFGRLVVIKRLGTASYGSVLWLCRCDCGVEKVVAGTNLVGGHVTSCGCLKRELLQVAHPINDLHGQVFGYLTVVRQHGRDKRNKIVWECRCRCSLTVYILGERLVSGHTRSCGCLKNELSRKRLLSMPNSGVSLSGTKCLDLLEQRLGVQIEREYRLGGRVFDGRILHVLIEVDSDFWHRYRHHIDVLKTNIAAKAGFSLVRIIINNEREILRQVDGNIGLFTELLQRNDV